MIAFRHFTEPACTAIARGLRAMLGACLPFHAPRQHTVLAHGRAGSVQTGSGMAQTHVKVVCTAIQHAGAVGVLDANGSTIVPVNNGEAADQSGVEAILRSSVLQSVPKLGSRCWWPGKYRIRSC